MNGFVIDSQANIRLKYDCGSLPKNQKNCFSCGVKAEWKSGKKMRAMPCGTVNGKPLTTNENEDYQRQELEEHEQVKERAEALAHKLAETYEELTRLLERNPAVKRQMTEGEAKEDKVYQKLKQRLKLADMAPRCRWVRQGGTTCGSPQMKNHIYCFAHKQMAEARTLLLMLPALEDANAIQVGLMRIQKALIEDTISMKKAGLLLYSMQLALQNVGQTTFGQAKDEEMVRNTVDEEEAFSEEARSNQHSAISETQNQNQNLFTTVGTEDTEETQGLPLMNDDTDRKEGLPRMDADERGLQEEKSRGDVEFVPVPGGYGFERIRLRMNPSGHQAIAPSIGTPPRAAVPQEHGEPYANLG